MGDIQLPHGQILSFQQIIQSSGVLSDQIEQKSFLVLINDVPRYHNSFSMDSIIEIISWLGALQGILLVLLLMTRDNNKNANRLLALFILIITLDCLEPIIFKKGNAGAVFKTWEFLWGGLVFLHGPLLFLYVKKMTTGESILLKSDLKHYSPPLLYYGILLITFIIPLTDRAMGVGTVVIYELFFLHLLIYSGASLIRIKNYQQAGHQAGSVANQIDLLWLKLLLITTLCLYIISFVTAQLQIIYPELEARPWNLTIQFILVFIMYTISYKSITQPQIFFPAHQNATNGTAKEKYQRSSLDPENANRIQEKLSAYMKEKKPFLDPNLSLETLSKQIGESRYHVSQVVNEKFKLKFNDFVNRYRVEEFKRLIMKPGRRKPTVETLAQLSGFNSKTSFHVVFKKMTGKTPSKFYRESVAGVHKESPR
jgi:AraC-like DNA-binding protein